MDDSYKIKVSVFSLVIWLIKLTVMVVAVVVGLLYRDCNKEMGDWLIIQGFMIPIVILLVMAHILCLPCMVLCCFIPFFLGMIGIIIFVLAWPIYGAVTFFPAASGPYPACPDGKDGMVLVITGVTIVAISFVFCCFPGFSVRRIENWTDEEENYSFSWTTRNVFARHSEALELGNMNQMEAGGIVTQEI